MLRRSLPWLLCLPALTACPGNSLEDFSGRELRVQILPTGSVTSERFPLKAELVRVTPEAGCLRLHDGVEATLNGAPLHVFAGAQTPDPDVPCGAPPTFNSSLEAATFKGEPRNAVLEIRDGDDRIVAEYQNFFAPHTVAQTQPPQAAKPGQEVFLAWDPPTDDLSLIDTLGVRVEGVSETLQVPVRPEAGGLRVTFPADLAPGRVFVVARAASIPAVRCEGVATCTALVSPVNFPFVEVLIQP